MKKTISILLISLSLLLILSPAAFAAEEGAALTEVETVLCRPFSLSMLLRIDKLETMLPDWIYGKMMGSLVSVDETPTQSPGKTPDTVEPTTPEDHAPNPNEAASKPAKPPNSSDSYYASYSPALYTPYTVKKTKTYYDSKGVAAYTLRLIAVFLDTETGSYCLQTTPSYTIYSGSWSISAGEARGTGNTATVSFTVTQRFTGFAINTKTVTLQVKASERTGNNYLMGDMNADGRLTSADARLALRAAAKLDSPTALQRTLGDINGDNKITAADARLILRIVVGLDK